MLYLVIALSAALIAAIFLLVMAMLEHGRLRAEMIRRDIQTEGEVSSISRMAIDHTDKLKAALDNAHKALELALAASPGPFKDVSVELGLNGITYHFNSLEEPVANTSQVNTTQEIV